MSSPKDYISIHSLRRFDVCNLFLPELPSRNIATFGFPSTLWFRIPAKPTKATKMELANCIVAFRRIILTAVQQSQQELFICIGGTEKLHILWLYFTVVLKKLFR